MQTRGMNRQRRLARLGLILAPLLLLGAGDAPTDIVAQRGGIKLTTADVRDLIDHADPGVRSQMQTSPAALAEFVRDRLLRQTLLADAHASGWDQAPDILARATDARDTVIVQTYLTSRTPMDPNFPSQNDVVAAYQSNRSRFLVPKQYHVAQVAILVPTGAPPQVEDAARRKAQDLRALAVKPKADFAELAKKNSQDRTSADRGGDLGWVREDQLVPAVREAVGGLADNAISEPVRSAEAWHVVKMLGVRAPSVLPIEQVRDSLAQALRQARAQQLARAYVDDLLRKEPIQLNEIDLAHRIPESR